MSSSNDSEPRTLEQVLADMSPERQRKVRDRSAQLIAAEHDERPRRFLYDGELYLAASADFMKFQVVLALPDGRYLEPADWIHGGEYPRIGFAHVFREARKGATVVAAHPVE